MNHPIQSDHRFLDSVIETSPALVVVTDEQGRIVLFNRACEEVTGYRRDEVLGKSLPETFLPPKWRPIVAARFANIDSLEVRKPHANPWLTKDGRERLIEWRCIALPRDNGFPASVLGAGIDITERTKAEEVLRESEQRFRTMADYSPVMIWVTDTKGAIEFVNRAYLDFFGVTEEEVRGPGNWTPLVHPDDVASYVEPFLAAVLEKKFFSGECRVRHAEGTWHWLATYASPRFSATGEFLGHVGTSPDITARKLLEYERHRNAEKLAKSLQKRTDELTELHETLRRTETMAILGTLSAGIAHDLGNLLLPLRGRLDGLRAMEVSPEVRSELRALEANVSYIGDLSRRLRRFIAAPDRHAEPATETIDLAKWCRDNESFLRTVVPDGITLTCDVPQHLPPLAIDAIGLTQTIYNLVQNSVKAIRRTSVGSQITIRAAVTDDARDTQEEVVEITVQDDGPGIAQGVMARCTDPHFTTGGGEGLGLTLVKTFIESACGEINLHSPPPGEARGTVLALRFPVKADITKQAVPHGAATGKI